MASYGVTQAGFVVKPLSQILADMQSQILATISASYDLSPNTPDGQMLGIYAASSAAVWELAQAAWNQFNRSDVEGAGLDNIGDLTGTPREAASYTQVFCTVTLAAGTYAAGSLVANVAGQSGQTFSNLYSITTAGGIVTGVLFQATQVGVTPSVNPGTLTVITAPVTGWSTVTNPAGQSQLGTAAELDPAYMLRQALDLAVSGSCNASATVAALEQLGAAQQTPVTLSVSVLENVQWSYQVLNGVGVPPHSWCVVVYDGGTGWATSNATLIAQTIFANKPAGVAPVGTTSATFLDPILGSQTIPFLQPAGQPLYVSATVVARPGVSHAALVPAIQAALVAAAVAPTPANGIAPNGQLAPGASVYQSQLEAVIMSVPGVLNVSALTFGFAPAPTNVAPLAVAASSIATLAAANVVVS